MKRHRIIASRLLVILLLPLVLSACATSKPPPKKILWWNVFDRPDVFTDMIKKFEDAKNVDIELVTLQYGAYEEQLISALAAGRGPDILTVHNTWLPEHRDLLAPVPTINDFPEVTDRAERRDLEDRIAALPQLGTYRDTYVPVVSDDFISENQIYAMPLYVDSLALYYNLDLLGSGGFPNPPRTWTEFANIASKLTIKDDNNNIIRAGAAMGTSGNINRSTDLLSTLMMQNGAQPVDGSLTFAAFNRDVELASGAKSNPGIDALTFYTNFANGSKNEYSWSLDPNVWYSIDSFAAGQAAMMINYSHQVDAVRAKNAKLNFDVAPLPQRDDSTFDVTYANYWGQAVSQGSDVKLEAWEFLNYITRDDNNLSYLQAEQKPPAKRSMIAAFENDLDLRVFAQQSAVAKSFYTPDINLTETVFARAIDDVNFGRRTPEEAINVAASQITQRLQTREYPPVGI